MFPRRDSSPPRPNLRRHRPRPLFCGRTQGTGAARCPKTTLRRVPASRAGGFLLAGLAGAARCDVPSSGVFLLRPRGACHLLAPLPGALHKGPGATRGCKTSALPARICSPRDIGEGSVPRGRLSAERGPGMCPRHARGGLFSLGFFLLSWRSVPQQLRDGADRGCVSFPSLPAASGRWGLNTPGRSWLTGASGAEAVCSVHGCAVFRGIPALPGPAGQGLPKGSGTEGQRGAGGGRRAVGSGGRRGQRGVAAGLSHPTNEPPQPAYRTRGCPAPHPEPPAQPGAGGALGRAGEPRGAQGGPRCPGEGG
nr:collagen alpha-2(I) chain-like [Anser cygnoides]